MMYLIIFALVLTTVNGLHILHCEPGDPGHLGCAQFVANGGQLGARQGVGAGQGGLFSQQATFGQSPGSLATDPSFWTNPGLQQPNLVDPTQFIDPTAQFVDPTLQFIDPTTQLDPNLQFIDPTQLTSPALDGGFGPLMDQASGIVQQGVEFAGGKMVYPKKSIGKSKIGSYPKGLLKKTMLGGYPKGKMLGYPKGGLKKLLNSYPKGKMGFKGLYNKYPKIGKSYMGLKNHGYYPKTVKVLLYPKLFKKAGYYSYPKSYMKKNIGFGGYYPKGYPKFSKKYKKFLGGY